MKAISVSAKVQGPVRRQTPWVRLVAVLGDVKLTVPSAGPPLYVPKKIAPLLSTTSQLPTIDLQLAADDGRIASSAAATTTTVKAKMVVRRKTTSLNANNFLSTIILPP